MRKMTKEIEGKVFREIRIRKVNQQEDYKKGFFWQTHSKHENGMTGYLQGLLDAGFKEEQINPILDRADSDVNKLYGLTE